MTANQLAVLLALYRGLQVAVDAEGWRGNFLSDMEQLKTMGLIYPTGSTNVPIVCGYCLTLRGMDVVKSALLLA